MDTEANINLLLFIEPMGKQRPRLSSKGRFSRAYTPKKTADWTKTARRAIKRLYSRKPIERSIPIEVKITAVHKRPQRLQRKCDPIGRIWKTTKPDIDNIAKIVYDSGNGLIWADDCQIVRSICEDVYAAKNEAPSISICIRRLDEYTDFTDEQSVFPRG